MKPYRWINLIMVAMLTLAFLPGGQVAAQSPAREAATRGAFVPGEVVVVFAEGQTASAYASQAAALAGKVGATVADQYQNLALLSFDPQADVQALARQIAASGQVQIAQPNYVYTLPEAKGMAGKPVTASSYVLPGATGKDIKLSWATVASLRHIVRRNGRAMSVPTFPVELSTGRLWGWDKVQADLIWGDKKANPLVCVLDTGVDSKHKDLSGKITLGKDFINNDAKPDDDNGHGTHVAGIIAAKLDTKSTGLDTAAGVSISKVLAVKVLNAQGYGTTYSVTAGLQSCIANSAVKIVNMSLASYSDDDALFNALNTAINTKGQLVVAAAGNESNALPVYPAFWAWNSTIADGLIAVGAARSPNAEGENTKIWVDSDNLGTIDPGETYNPEECATGGVDQNQQVYGSNYGFWVSIVAPGENIYSTTPMSYPFYGQYYENLSSGYDYMSGTSQAAAFVAGAAARVWSVTTATPINKRVKTALIDGGDPLDFASDGTTDPDFDAMYGYDNQTGRTIGGEPIEYGVPFQDGNQTYIMAPFCWPEVNGNFGSNETMAGDGGEPWSPTKPAVYLNVAKAMGRGALVAEIKNAISGTPLDGATVTARSGGVVRDTAKTVMGNGLVVLTNLPFNGPTDYQLTVAKSGFTAGTQVFNYLDDINARGTAYFDKYSSVGLAPNTAISAVLDWIDPTINAAEGQLDPSVDFDLYLWLPHAVNGGDGGIIGTMTLRSGDVGIAPKLVVYYPALEPIFLGIGSLTPVAGVDMMSLFNFDGGLAAGIDPQGQVINPTESLSIAVSTVGTAYYAARGDYTIIVTDYSQDNLYSGNGRDEAYLTRDPNDPNFSAPVVRFWLRGVLLPSNIIKLQSSADGACNGTKDFWKVATLRNTVTPSNTCNTNDPPGFLPYVP